MSMCRRWLLVTVCLFLVSCINWASDEDYERVKVVEREYGHLLKITLEEESYVRISPKDNKEIDENLAKHVYRLFFFPEGEEAKLRKTEYFYLNVYDRSGDFKYQIAFDKVKRDFVKNKREHE